MPLIASWGNGYLITPSSARLSPAKPEYFERNYEDVWWRSVLHSIWESVLIFPNRKASGRIVWPMRLESLRGLVRPLSWWILGPPSPSTLSLNRGNTSEE